MAEKVISTCESCGARLEENAVQCGLCGWIVGSKDHDLSAFGEEHDEPQSHTVEEELDAEVDEENGIYCHNCGWHNLPGANFCSSCGTRLQKVERQLVKKASPPPSVSEKKPAIPEAELVSSSAEPWRKSR